MLAPSRASERCPVCGCADVRTDEAVDGVVVFLARCPRCDHRACRREPGVRPVLRARPEVGREDAAA